MKNNQWLIFVFLPLLSLLMCNTQSDVKFASRSTFTDSAAKNKKYRLIYVDTSKHWTLHDFYKNDSVLSKEVDHIFDSMGISERAAQLIMPATGISKKYGLPFSKILQLYKEKKIGGVLLLKGSSKLFTSYTKSLNSLAQKDTIIPLVYSCDCEPTLFHRKITDADSMTVASSLLTNEQVRESATVISREMKKMGIHWNFAPVADIKVNKAIINKRSFSNNPAEVIEKSLNFIKAAADENIATTIKHFPGHGAITGDSHQNLVYIDSILTEVNNFQSIINQAHPPAVMMGHIAVKNNRLYNTQNQPASLSSKITTGLLQKNLGFSGIVITDAMNMGAVSKIAGADYLAILAGNDVVLMPQNVRELHKKISVLLQGNTERKKQIEKSVKKIIKLKICLGIIT
jgi:beta-N-acetylhexosaminidase